MVQLSAHQRLGPVSGAFALLTGLAVVAMGVGLLLRADSAFGAVWASVFVVFGVAGLISCGAALVGSPASGPPAREVRWEDEPARFLARRGGHTQVAGMVVLVLVGGWFLVMGVVGAIAENWFWPVLATFPAVYFLGFPALAAAGRFRPGGVWLTPSRVVDEHFGVRSELALVDVTTVIPRSDSVHVTPTGTAVVTHRKLTPRLWRARVRPGDLVIRSEGVLGDSEELAAEVRRHVAAARG